MLQETLPTSTQQTLAADDHGQYLARRTAELAAKLRTEEEGSHARKVRHETWEREADRKEREAKSDTAAAFMAYAKACGYSPESERLMMAAMGATRGADRLASAPDWMMGIWLGGGDAEDVARIEPLPAHSQEKRNLAQSWKRAWDAFDKEQKGNAFDTITRQPGTKDFRTGKNKTSAMHVHFVQHLVEVEREAKTMRGVRRFERFERAAQIVVERLRRECMRPAEIPKENRLRRPPQPDTPALCTLRLTEKIRKLAGAEIKRAIAAGAQPDDVHLMLESAFDELGKAFAAVEPETIAEGSSALPLEDLSSIKRSSNAQIEDSTEEKSDAHFEETNCENIEENRKVDGVLVFKFEYQPPPENLPETPPEFTVELDTATLDESPLDDEEAAYRRFDDSINRRADELMQTEGATWKEAQRAAWAEHGIFSQWLARERERRE